MREEVVDELVVEAIFEGARAGIFRTAARLNPNAKVWRDLAEQHSRRVAAILDEVMCRLGADGAGP